MAGAALSSRQSCFDKILLNIMIFLKVIIFI